MRTIVIALLLTLGVDSAIAGNKPNPSTSTVTTGAGVLFACPAGDGETLGSRGLTVTATIRSIIGSAIPGIPATDFWLFNCGPDLSICTASAPFPTGWSDINGQIVLDGRVTASGCDNTGVRLVVMGIIFPDCLPIQVRTPDLKTSAGGCAAETICPDGKVDLGDFAYFATHFPSAANPDAAYSACGDIAAPYGGNLGLADLTRFATHLTGTHTCGGYRVSI